MGDFPDVNTDSPSDTFSPRISMGDGEVLRFTQDTYNMLRGRTRENTRDWSQLTDAEKRWLWHASQALVADMERMWKVSTDAVDE